MEKESVGELRHRRYRLLLQISVAFFGLLSLASGFYPIPLEWQGLGFENKTWANIRLSLIGIGLIGGISALFILNGLLAELEIELGFKQKGKESETITKGKTYGSWFAVVVAFFLIGYFILPPLLGNFPISSDARFIQGVLFALYGFLLIWFRLRLKRRYK